MYNPSLFKEERLDVIRELMANFPLAALVTLGQDGLVASHLPLIHDAAPEPYGRLRGHMARANPQWRHFSPAVPALAIFNGPRHYISPSWYPSKADHGKVVPTFNYAVVHAYGRLSILEDPERLREHVRDLTDFQEAHRDQPWRIDDPPAGYVEGQLPAIVGIEMVIDRLEGKWKVSQNRPAPDRVAVSAALRELNTSEGRAMADLVEDHDPSRRSP